LNDGSLPYGNLVFDTAGALYGTTNYGGGSANCSYGCGTVFEVAPISRGWKTTILHAFSSFNDGALPYSGLVIDSAGNLYGTTFYGGGTQYCTLGCGSVFEVSGR
jgi:hypothetical protein